MAAKPRVRPKRRRTAQQALRADLEATNRLLRLGSLFLREGNLESVLGEIVDAAIAISGADFGNLQLLDGASGDLKIAAQRGFPDWWLRFWDQVSQGRGSCGTALERRERVIVEDVETSPIFVGTPGLEVQLKAGVRACQSTPLFGRAGAPIGMLSTHFKEPGRPDEHALRQLDLLARQAADILERSWAERALEEANRRLLEADRRKDELLGMLSHELRNPLSGIRNGLYILDRAAPGSEQARRAQEVVNRQVTHMTRLLEDLLDATRLTHGKIQLQRELFELNELARHAAADHRAAFAERGVELEVRAAPAEAWVNGDRTRVAQAIGNLLQNAAQFTPRGGRATLSVERDTTLRRAVVRVQDTGRGIAPELLPRLFEAFTQADATLDRQQGGLGLGLAVAKGLVELHGGSIRGESDGPGAGTTFTIALPLEGSGPVKAHQPRGHSGGASRRVLVIEDNSDAADSLREVLELGGHEVEVADSGPAGLERARAFRPEVVLCDIGLPGMDGYELARRMRADPAVGRVTLVALTGYARPEDVKRAREAGFDIHLAKPPTARGLERVLGETPDQRR